MSCQLGAFDGFGEALAENFARGGYNLVLVARSENKLQALARQFKKEHNVRVSVEPADLSHRGAATFTGRATPKWLLRRIWGVMGHYTLRS